MSLALPAGSEEATRPAAISVQVSIPPQADLVERIGGPRVSTGVMIPSGASPPTYSPRPHQLQELAHADVYVQVGHPDFVFERMHIDPHLARRPELTVVDMSAGLTLETRGDSPNHEDHDPHVWLSPTVMESTGRSVMEALSTLDPAHAAGFRARFEQYRRDLRQLDAELVPRFAALDSRRFLVLHPAWGWFATHYGLEQIAVDHHGKSPSPRQLVPLIEKARSNGIRVVFVQRGLPERSAEWIAREIGGEIVELDPLERDWFANMRRVSLALERSGSHE